MAELGGGLLAAFHVLLESSRVGSQGAGALRRAGIELSRAATSREVLAVVQAINALREADERKLQTVLDPLRAPLKRAAGADFSESELISICETLLRRDEITQMCIRDSTWITRDMQRAYWQLFESGIAHSVETWFDGQLVGGLYGLAIGRMFYGESMFSRCLLYTSRCV